METPSSKGSASAPLISLAASKKWEEFLATLDELETASAARTSAERAAVSKDESAVERNLEKEFEETDPKTGNTVAHFVAAAGHVEALEKLVSLVRARAEGDTNSGGRYGILRAKNRSNRTPLSLLEMEIAQVKNRLEDELEETLDPEKRANFRKRLETLEQTKTWLLNNCYSATERLFYGDGSFEQMVKEFSACPAGLYERLEFYNDMPYPFLCVEENDRQKIAWIASQQFPAPPSAPGVSTPASPLELRDDEGNTVLHLVHFEVDLGPLEDEEDEEDEEAEESGKPRAGKNIKAAAETTDDGDRKREAAEEETTPPGEEDEKKHPRELAAIGESVLKALTQSDKDTLLTLNLLLSYPLVKNFVNTPNNHGQTPAHFIAEDAPTGDAAHAAMILLVNAGANLNIKDGDGRTPFMALCGAHGGGPWVAWAQRPRHEGGGGVDPLLKDNEGRTFKEYIEMGEDDEDDCWDDEFEDEEEE
ncbi:hypothetical protein TGME49_265150 [Toxoplasma gondii ME49]|uniref:Uncharacterized protein n=2 Tax=Toxoplasma gondii TaxID=5811 RepID=S8EZB5_TOXGM|nr:hypothetical protein TGME49_265150 [Toxoplasma gondii ME49]EPT27747.1 hypothetical protein TGME49_265150 [Toxoplasma gondii ME49]|eukprot:XP_002368644.1 hypothetical protein TGME49_265150 [Toxoplasma gondii ME49]